MARITTERFDVASGTDVELVLESDCTAIRVLSDQTVRISAFVDQEKNYVSAVSSTAANTILSDLAVGRFVTLEAQSTNTWYYVIKQFESSWLPQLRRDNAETLSNALTLLSQRAGRQTNRHKYSTTLR
jgi:hypothetical protein